MITIERADGTRARAEYLRHLRTLTSNNSTGSDNQDLDLFRLEDGTRIECASPANNSRATPREVTDDDAIRGYS